MGALQFGHRIADDRCPKKGHPPGSNAPCAILSDKSDGVNNSRWLPERSGKLSDTWTGVRVRCRSGTREAVTDAYGEGTQEGCNASPSDPGGRSPAGFIPSVTAMSQERNGKV